MIHRLAPKLIRCVAFQRLYPIWNYLSRQLAAITRIADVYTKISPSKTRIDQPQPYDRDSRLNTTLLHRRTSFINPPHLRSPSPSHSLVALRLASVVSAESFYRGESRSLISSPIDLFLRLRFLLVSWFIRSVFLLGLAMKRGKSKVDAPKKADSKCGSLIDFVYSFRRLVSPRILGFAICSNLYLLGFVDLMFLFLNFWRLGVRKGSERASKIPRKTKAEKDPNKPKRPPSAFFVFMWDYLFYTGLYFIWCCHLVVSYLDRQGRVQKNV